MAFMPYPALLLLCFCLCFRFRFRFCSASARAAMALGVWQGSAATGGLSRRARSASAYSFEAFFGVGRSFAEALFSGLGLR